MPCAPLGLTAPGLKRLSFQMSRTKGIGGQAIILGLLLHERADDLDEGLRPRKRETRLLHACLDACERRGLPPLARRGEKNEGCNERSYR